MASIQDFNIDWKRKRVFIPVTSFTGLTFGLRTINAGPGPDALETDGTSVVTSAATATLFDPVTATPRNIIRTGRRDLTGAASHLVELNALGTYGLVVVAVNDGCRHFAMVDTDIDTTRPVGFTAHWTSGAAAVGARSVTWRVRYSALAANGVLVAPATALDTVITAATPVGVGWEYQQSPRGIIAVNTLAEATIGFNLRVDVSALAGWAGAGSNDNPFLLGLEIDFVPNRTYGGRRSNRDRRLTTNPLGTVESA